MNRQSLYESDIHKSNHIGLVTVHCITWFVLILQSVLAQVGPPREREIHEFPPIAVVRGNHRLLMVIFLRGGIAKLGVIKKAFLR